MQISIFTPVYNRADLLQSLFESLKKQSFRDFEWIIVDDGSRDHISEVVQGFMNDDSRFFEVQFVRQENSGKHMAINRGIDMAQGKFFFIVDSDDHLPEDALEKIYDWVKTVEHDDSFCGVSGTRGTVSNILIGNTFEGHFLDAYYWERASKNIIGDKAEVYKTEVLKNFKFPSFGDEKFLTEETVWYLMGEDYKIRYYNDIIYYSDYLDDGLSKNINKHLLNSPKGYAYSIQIRNKYSRNSLKSRLASYYYYGELFSGLLTEEEIIENLQIRKETYIFAKLLWNLVYRIKNK
ncbi:glycosyltransferase family 2 protein [Kaistella sp. DKR-2]|uniref:glycosyltransferase family 2 protein n=1 Tax=Kaistella soli TaxID=2849654 RepID=UPI001C2559CD|nr:glycosyltransferase family 2 protein [Kaistella soli]MBU8883070.1 glycosyltransferase family 2 protein [Kaistella soli]